MSAIQYLPLEPEAVCDFEALMDFDRAGALEYGTFCRPTMPSEDCGRANIDGNCFIELPNATPITIVTSLGPGVRLRRYGWAGGQFFNPAGKNLILILEQAVHYARN